jgi:hypothetical protein
VVPDKIAKHGSMPAITTKKIAININCQIQ